MELKNLFGKRLKKIREAKGLTQQELFNFDCKDGLEPSKQNLLDYLNTELKDLDEHLLQHMIKYSKLVKEFYTSKK